MRNIVKYALIAGGIVVVGAGATGLAYYFSTYPREVFIVSLPSGSTPAADAHKVAKKFGFLGFIGANVATKGQLAAAQKAGAGWCSSGWVAEADGTTIKDSQYPMQDMPIDPVTKNPISGCGDAHTINTCNPPSCSTGVTIYGKKPKQTSDTIHGYTVHPWSSAEWSQFKSK